MIEGLDKDPNKATRPLKTEWSGNRLAVEGYQNYMVVFDQGSVALVSPRDNRLIARDCALDDYWHLVQGKSVLDLGANAGYWSLRALMEGAESVVAAEMMHGYCELLRSLSSRVNILPFVGKVEHLSGRGVFDSAHVVFAFALIHWLYACTAQFGSLPKIIEFLRSLTRDTLFLEWVDPGDPAIERGGHLEYHGGDPEGYTAAQFQEALKASFPWVRVLPGHTPTRQMVICRTKNPHSSIWIEDGIVYKIPTAFLEFGILMREDFWNYILPDDISPAWWGSCAGGRGNAMRDCGDPVRKETLPHNWRDQAENILGALKKHNCRHNDIRPDNICVKDGKLRLIDFAWATESWEEIPEEWPKGLGGRWAKGEHDFDDRYSLFKSLEEVDGG